MEAMNIIAMGEVHTFTPSSFLSNLNMYVSNFPPLLM
jgi:hypothetical protein